MNYNFKVVEQTAQFLKTAGKTPFNEFNEETLEMLYKALVEEYNEFLDANSKEERANAIADLRVFVSNFIYFFYSDLDFNEFVEKIVSELGQHAEESYAKLVELDGLFLGFTALILDQGSFGSIKDGVDNCIMTCINALMLLEKVYVRYVDKDINNLYAEEERTFKSNMTKFCMSLEEAEKTKEAYANGTHPNKPGTKIEVLIKETNEVPFRYRVELESGKIMKSIDFVDADQF